MPRETNFFKKPQAPALRFFISQKGMTLLEVLIAIAIVAGVISLFVTRIDNSNNQIKESVRKLAIISRELYYKAKLTQSTYRLVIDMQEGEDSENVHRFWVEKGHKDFLASAETSHRKFNKRAQTSAEAQKEEERKANQGGFAPDTRIMKEPKALPSPLFFEGVELANHSKMLTEGKVYIHYLPQGFVDEAAIHIKLSDKTRWTLAIHPLTGRGEIYSEHIELKEIRDQ